MPEEKPFIEILYSGLCSFVETKDSQGDGQIHVLLVEASRSKAAKEMKEEGVSLCRHHSLIVFQFDQREQFVGASDSSFYKSFVHQDAQGGEIVSCVWDIEGYDIEIRPNRDIDSTQSKAVEFDTKNILSLDKAPVARRWLHDDLANLPLLDARVRLKHGLVEAGKTLASNYSMRSLGNAEGDQGNSFASTVVHRVQRAIGDIEFNGIKNGERHWLRVGKGARVSISCLCPVTREPQNIEHEVLAFYELASQPPAITDRPIPHSISAISENATPRQSACPPVTQPSD